MNTLISEVNTYIDAWLTLSQYGFWGFFFGLLLLLIAGACCSLVLVNSLEICLTVVLMTFMTELAIRRGSIQPIHANPEILPRLLRNIIVASIALLMLLSARAVAQTAIAL
jgi:hypothetical protein